MPGLEPSVSRVSTRATSGRQRNSDVVERFRTVGDSAAALHFTTIASFFLALVGVRWEDTGRSHWDEFLYVCRLQTFHSLCDVYKLPNGIDNCLIGRRNFIVLSLRNCETIIAPKTPYLMSWEKRGAQKALRTSRKSIESSSRDSFPTPSADRLEKKREELDYEFHASRLFLSVGLQQINRGF